MLRDQLRDNDTMIHLAIFLFYWWNWISQDKTVGQGILFGLNTPSPP